MSQQTDRLSAALAGRYRIERHLGEGGMASVYLAGDLKHDRKIAVKILKPELAAVLGAGPPGTPGAARHLVVLNWFTELKARVEQGNR